MGLFQWVGMYSQGFNKQVGEFTSWLARSVHNALEQKNYRIKESHLCWLER